MLESAVWRCELLEQGARLHGPAVIEEAGAATLVPPGFALERHGTGALILTREGET